MAVRCRGRCTTDCSIVTVSAHFKPIPCTARTGAQTGARLSVGQTSYLELQSLNLYYCTSCLDSLCNRCILHTIQTGVLVRSLIDQLFTTSYYLKVTQAVHTFYQIDQVFYNFLLLLYILWPNRDFWQYIINNPSYKVTFDTRLGVANI